MTANNSNSLVLKIIRKYSLWALCLGFLPIPVLGVVAIIVVQLLMLSELAKTYGGFDKIHTAKWMIVAIIVALAVLPLSRAAVTILKAVPVVGSILAFLILPAIAGVVTAGLGRYFMSRYSGTRTA
ncbi:hypothetical protein OYT1_ch2353 [Ferriphaselus amnicola]|uniref:Transmembrane protein n=1 Tax=Ferriphaselus amnicola TaxID=1188319 RepID=A0A2Z6GE88_9PROT|nr:hypothetical protein [Ferriphaselus amnicola]BBE51868.1 hypothetical protein OYT1_ch2353 [Ferriphaselus amnicola]